MSATLKLHSRTGRKCADLTCTGEVVIYERDPGFVVRIKTYSARCEKCGIDSGPGRPPRSPEAALEKWDREYR